MQYSEPENFSFTDDQVDIEKTIRLLWQNDSSVTDWQIAYEPSEPSPLPTELDTQLTDSWQNLETRAAAYLSAHADGPDAFYSDKVLRFMRLEPGKIIVSDNLDYRTVTGIRSNAALYTMTEAAGLRENAYVTKSIFITADNKLVLGKRNFFGDWPWFRYECPGGFLGRKDLALTYTSSCAIKRIQDDYIGSGQVTVLPFMLYDFDRILETIMLCLATTNTHSDELQSDFYSELLFTDNTPAGVAELLSRSPSEFHPPSRIALELYHTHFEAAQHLLARN